MDRQLAAGQGRDQQHAQSYTKSASYCAIRSILPQNIPTNEGVFRAISVTAPEGTIANMVLPGACAARGLTGFRMVDCMFGALAKMLPDQVFAASDGGNTGVSIGGWHKDRTPFIYVDFTCCAWGARPYADGLDGNSHIYANMASQPIEVTESEQPLQITAYEFIQDAMGPGKFRGGAPFRREYRLLADEAILQVRSDRHAFRPFGLYGGGPGRPSMNYLNPDTNPEPLPSKLTMTMHRGDLFRHEVAGGGGWGDPLERDPALVLRDVLNDFVSPHQAREDYGVVLTGEPARRGRGRDRGAARRDAGHRGTNSQCLSLDPDQDTVIAAKECNGGGEGQPSPCARVQRNAKALFPSDGQACKQASAPPNGMSGFGTVAKDTIPA